MVEIQEMLKKLSIAESTVSGLMKKPQFVNNMEDILEVTPSITRLHYSLACTAPKGVDIKKVAFLINQGLVKHENMLRGTYFYYEKRLTEPIEDFIKSYDKSEEEIKKIVEAKKGNKKEVLLREVKKEAPFIDFKVVIDIINNMPSSFFESDKLPVVEKKTPFGWLEEGEVSLLCKPEENLQANEEILQEHLRRTGGRVVTRFPPEPNGHLHIGHVKAINLSFEYAKKNGGITYLRFDDTNPRNEKKEYYQSIMEDIEWLGFKPEKITASSDYNDFMNEKSIELIKKGKAYVCHCSLEDIRHRRFIFQKEREEGNTDYAILSPYRNRSVEKNLKEFERMLNGEYPEGKAILRFRMDSDSKNPHMLDLVGSRIIDAIHPGKGRNWKVYPSYEFALCVADSLEDVTHSFCSREFQMRQESYHWLLRALEMYEPIQWEFSRLNLSNTVLSKRKINELVRRGIEWDDPRLYTIKGMRRRGFPPQAINRFVQSVGFTFSESIIDVKLLENFVREELDATSSRVYCIKKPLKITLNNWQKRKVEIPSAIKDEPPYVVELKKTLYTEADDYQEDDQDGYMRLTPNQPVGLIGLGCIKYNGKITDGIVCELSQEKPKKYIHWLPDLSHQITLRIYEPLFRSFNPDAVGYLDDIHMESLSTITAFSDYRLKEAKPLDRFQFVRQGYYCCDRTLDNGNKVFNLTLPLKSAH